MGQPVLKVIPMKGGMVHHLGGIKIGIDMMNTGIIVGGEVVNDIDGCKRPQSK